MQEVLIRAGSFVAIIILGYVLRRVGFFKQEDFKLLSKIVIKITLPGAIITSFAGKEIAYSMLAIVFLALGAGVLYMLIAAVLNMKKDRNQKAFEVLNLPGYNIGNFTLPFVQSFLGPTGVIATSLFDVGNAFVCLGGAYGVASMIKENKGFSLKRIVNSLKKSVPFLCYILMITLNLLHISLPSPVISAASVVGNANAFLAMLMMGVGFQLSGDKKQIGSMVKILGIRYGVAAVLAFSFYTWLPFETEIRRALAILVFSPIGSAVPAFTEELKEDAGLSSALNSISIVISIICIITILTLTA